ncbi:TetR/AcrR family transcriptional regulator [Geobacter sp. SVR]|uniref:TetR/AcrR family transcriptional regulator n=1 Tax=Geobacter sp. SVR TaxID=2495594 RepID=UPI00143EFA32|nr:TetR/AcrR family transcriptional regulator [Geobacter sp. SVR]BCS55399.1 TetR family transcriptional regulator [Geobacter sp. SVR]GCF83401.1 TetR family transcriptional regulator [Geobacter sp. SVR]
MTKRDTRTELIAAGMALIAAQGYNATGIDAVLKRTGVPKGSFYHYFGSKEEFGLAVIEEFAARFLARVDVLLADPALPPLERLRAFLERGLERLAEHQCTVGCLIGDLGQELAARNERLRERLDEILFSWRERFAACIREAQHTGELPPSYDPLVIAGFVLSGWEGAVLSAKVMKSPQPVRDFIDTLFATVLTPQ